jgi:hypothetical protein
MPPIGGLTQSQSDTLTGLGNDNNASNFADTVALAKTEKDANHINNARDQIQAAVIH